LVGLIDPHAVGPPVEYLNFSSSARKEHRRRRSRGGWGVPSSADRDATGLHLMSFKPPYLPALGRAGR
jgi:hypothetical protein